MKRTVVISLCSIALLGIVARLAAQYSRWEIYPNPLYPDEEVYCDLAKNLMKTGAFDLPPGNPEIHRAPLFPYVNAFLFRLFGVQSSAILILQAFAGGSIALIVPLALRSALVAHNASNKSVWWSCILASCALAFSPIALIHDRRLMGESLATFSLCCGVSSLVVGLAKIKERRVRSQFFLGLSGLGLGFSILAKPALIYLPAFLAIGGIFVVRQRAQIVAGIGLMFLGMIVTIGPWTWRNYQETGRFIPVAIGSGKRIYLATFPKDQVQEQDETIVADYYAGRYMDGGMKFQHKLQADRELKSLGIQRINAAPIDYLKYSTYRFAKMWVSSHAASITGSRHAEKVPRVIRYGVALGSLVVLALAAFGTYLLFLRKLLALVPFAITPAYIALVHFPLEGGARYVVPAWPFLITLACLFVSAGAGEFLRKSVNDSKR